MTEAEIRLLGENALNFNIKKTEQYWTISMLGSITTLPLYKKPQEVLECVMLLYQGLTEAMKEYLKEKLGEFYGLTNEQVKH